MLPTDGEPDEVRRHARGKLIFGLEQLVCGGGRVNGQGLGLADIGQMADKVKRLDKKNRAPAFGWGGSTCFKPAYREDDVDGRDSALFSS